uniref:Uncharacterized protein n=1 Tax=Janibacter limosus TaxID=53458 RepID=A0AC61U783_9MICO|nr:hypothetical protein [Janibacter limosus]
MAVTAPSGTKAKDVHDTAGAPAVDPVVKPKPKPKPKPTPKPEPVEQPVDKTVDKPDTTAAPQASESRAPDQTSRSSQRQSAQPESTDSSDPEPTQAPSGSVNTSNYASQGAAPGHGRQRPGGLLGRAHAVPRPDQHRWLPAPATRATTAAATPSTSCSHPRAVTGSTPRLQQNAGSLNIKYIIWQQRIWFPNGSSKMMSDRGSATQNHYDHVHVSVN